MEHRIKNNIQISTAGNNHHIIIAGEKKKDKNHKKLNIKQLNSSTCDKTDVNNSNNNGESELLDQDDKKSEVRKLLSNSISKLCIEKKPCTAIVKDSTVKHHIYHIYISN